MASGPSTFYLRFDHSTGDIDIIDSSPARPPQEDASRYRTNTRERSSSLRRHTALTQWSSIHTAEERTRDRSSNGAFATAWEPSTQKWGSAGEPSTQKWGSAGHSSTQKWGSAGEPSTQKWGSAGEPSTQKWGSAGEPSTQKWGSAWEASTQKWGSAWEASTQKWGSAGEPSTQKWGSAGEPSTHKWVGGSYSENMSSPNNVASPTKKAHDSHRGLSKAPLVLLQHEIDAIPLPPSRQPPPPVDRTPISSSSTSADGSATAGGSSTPVSERSVAESDAGQYLELIDRAISVCGVLSPEEYHSFLGHS
ncbi:hypothetical protein FOZ62_021087 [Perkinsus olseni]|uniref:Uncharacterized protein n=1 Tax=Perkinsus olseni TaxID=32597 RepID=A0A7J6PUH7_PEROL|nr:hypothetical protein FOZ62_021087 [Perkinsus olseni]